MFVFCCGPVIPATKNLRQEDHIFEASMASVSKINVVHIIYKGIKAFKVFHQLRALVLTFYT